MRRAQEYVGKDGKNLQFAFDVLDPVTFADGVKVFKSNKDITSLFQKQSFAKKF